MNSKTIKIVIAEKKELFRKGLSVLLQKNSEFSVAGEACDETELFNYLKIKHVDIVLMDKDLPTINVESTLDTLQKKFPDVRTVIFANEANAQLKSEFMAQGANCFLSKDTDIQTLFTALFKVKTEGFFFDDSTSKALLDSILKTRHRTSRSPDVDFSTKETDILKQICDGLTNKEIAMKLHVRESTIDFYKAKIYSKTKSHNVPGLLKYALKNGIVRLY